MNISHDTLGTLNVVRNSHLLAIGLANLPLMLGVVLGRLGSHLRYASNEYQKFILRSARRLADAFVFESGGSEKGVHKSCEGSTDKSTQKCHPQERYASTSCRPPLLEPHPTNWRARVQDFSPRQEQRAGARLASCETLRRGSDQRRKAILTPTQSERSMTPPLRVDHSDCAYAFSSLWRACQGMEPAPLVGMKGLVQSQGLPWSTNVLRYKRAVATCHAYDHQGKTISRSAHLSGPYFPWTIWRVLEHTSAHGVRLHARLS